MAYVIGFLLAPITWAFLRVTRMDRDGAVYPLLLMTFPLYYILYAVMGGSARALALETIPMTVFFAIAILGFNKRPWLVAAGMAGHGVWDFLHGYFITNPGMPAFWPAFCGSIDVGFGILLAWPLLRARSANEGVR